MAAPSYVNQGGVVLVTTAAVPSFPAVTAGNLLLLVVTTDTGTIGTPDEAGFTELGTALTDGGMTTRKWSKIATGSETGQVTVSTTGGTKGLAWISQYAPDVPGSVLTATIVTPGVDNDATSTAYSATSAGSWTLDVDNRVVGLTIMVTTGAFTSNATSPTLAQTGATLSNTARFAQRASTNTLYCGQVDASVTTGSTNSPTLTATTNGANGTGQTIFVKITETASGLAPIDITHVGASAWVAPASSAAVAPTYPSSLAENDVVYATLVIKPDTATVTTPTDWTLVTSQAVGGGTQGAGTGAVAFHLFKRTVPAGGLTGSQSFTITGGSSPVAHMRAFRADAGPTSIAWDAETTTFYSRTTASATFGGTGAADIALSAKDYLVFVSASSDDQSSIHTISALAATGATLASSTQSPGGTIVNAQGNDISAAAAYALVTAGTSTAAPSSTVSGGSSETGGGFFFRVSAQGVTTPSASGTGTITQTNTVTGEGIKDAPGGTGTISQTNTVTSTGTKAAAGTGTISATHDVTASGLNTASGTSSISQTNTVTSDGSKQAIGAAYPIDFEIEVTGSGSGELASNDKTGTGSISQTSDATATGTKATAGTTTISHTHTITSTGVRISYGTAALSQTSTVTSAGTKAGLGTATISQADTVTSTGTRTGSGTGSISQAHTVTSTGEHWEPGSAAGSGTITVATAVTGSGTKAGLGVATISATHTLTGSGDGVENQASSGTSSITQASDVTGSGGKTSTFGVASISVTHTLTGQGYQIEPATPNGAARLTFHALPGVLTLHEPSGRLTLATTPTLELT